jgi:hypothetical protein
MKVSELDFKKTIQGGGEDTLFGCNTDLGRISVLDRMTGWGNGIRGIETGYSDKNGKFWLASCGFDIREYPDLDLPQAIEKIKEYANTCVGV